MVRNIVAATALLLYVQSAVGLGLGSLQKSSALNEPFDGQIEILGATATDFDTLTIKLADSEQFERANVPRDAILLGLRFRIVQSRSGADHIAVSSQQPIKEPFLNFLVELNWANGKMVREYTVLLDPPLYDPVRRPAAPRPAPAAQLAQPESGPMPAAEPMAAPMQATVAPGAPSGSTIGPVQANDTLWALANAHRPGDVSVQQMMLALFRSNPEAFGDNNINVLKRGAVLRMPDQDELAALSQSDAIAEARRHHQMWENYRQTAAADVAEQPMGPADDDLGDMLAADDEITDDDARLELVAPDADDAGTAAAGTGTGDSLLQEQLDATAQENSELRAKIVEADEIIDLMQRQVDIKDEELAALQARLAELGLEQADVMPDEMDSIEQDIADMTPPEEEPVAATEPEETEMTEEPVMEEDDTETEIVAGVDEVDIDVGDQTTAPIETDAPPSDSGEASEGFLSGILPSHITNMVPGGATTILAAIAALLLLVFGGIIKWLMGGREEEPQVSEPEVSAAIAETAAETTDDVVDEFDETVEGTEASELETDTIEALAETPSSFEDTLEATADDLAPAEEPVVEPVEDPLEEVNVYLAYERFDQAEELVRKVIAEYPDEHKYKLRLLEVFYSSNDQASYEATARDLLDAVGEDDPMWESALAMWSEMSPDRALFAEGAPEPGPADTGGMKAFVDITADDEHDKDTVSMAPSGESTLEATAIGLTNEDDEVGPVDFNLSEDDDSIELDGTLELDISKATDEEILDLTTAGDAEIDGDDIFDLTATSEAPTDDEGVVDLTVTDSLDLDDDEPLDLTSPAGTDHDLLDVTKTGDMSGDQSDDLLNVTSPGMLDETSAGGEDNSVDFDISDTVTPVFDATEAEPGGEDVEMLDVTGGDGADDTLDFEIGGLDSEAVNDDMTVEFNGGAIPTPAAAGAVADLSEEIDDLTEIDTLGDNDMPTMEIEAPAETSDTAHDTNTVDFDLSLQSPELDALSDTSDATPDGDAAIDFDLALEDTSDMDSIIIDETLEMPKPTDSADESLEDLTKSMEESMAELELDMDSDDSDTSDLDLDGEIDLDVGDFDIEADDGIAIEAGTGLGDDDSVAVEETLVLPTGSEGDGGGDEIDTKLNLAKAYIELGDNDGARSILDEVVRDGSEEQQSEAQQLLDQIN